MTDIETNNEEIGVQREAWHLSKEVPIALILTMVSMLVAATFAWSKMDSRIESVEKAQLKAEVTATASDQKVDKKLDQIQSEIAKLNQSFMQAQIDASRARK